MNDHQPKQEFDQELEHIRTLGFDADANWEDLNNLLFRLQAASGHDDARQREVKALREDILTFRRTQFQTAYDRVQQEILDNQIPDDDAFYERRRRLQALAAPENRSHMMRQLTDAWDRRRDVNEVRDWVNEQLALYKVAIEREDFNKARLDYLNPAEKRVEALLQKEGMHPDLLRLLLDVKQAIKDADKTALHTNAVEHNFRVIIEDLQERPGDYIQPLVDEDGVQQGTMARDEALQWYRNRAVKFAEKKAAEYLDEAELQLRRENPIVAEFRLAEADSLYMLPVPAREKTRRFRETRLEPMLERINRARRQLTGIPYAENLDDALRAYREALDPETGWPAFDTLAAQEEEARRTSAMPEIQISTVTERDLVVQARSYIYEMMEREIADWLRQLPSDEASPDAAMLIYNLDAAALERFESHLNWGDKRLLEQYGEAFSQLEAAYNRQIENRARIEEATAQAQGQLKARSFLDAYRTLEPWRETIEAAPDYYPEAIAAWYQAYAFRDTRGIRLDIDNEVNLGADPDDLPGQIRRLRDLDDRVEAAFKVNPDEADEVGLTDARKTLIEFIALLEGMQAETEDRLEEAVQVWGSRIGEGSPFFDMAQRAINEVAARIEVDQDLADAFQAAEEYYASGYLREAFATLRPHADKRTARDFQRLTALLADVRHDLTARLVEEIDDNIIRQPEDPAELIRLQQELEEANPATFHEMAAQIDFALRYQNALHAEVEATGTRSEKLWQRAYESWRAVGDPRFGEQVDRVRLNYVDALINAALEASTQPDVDVPQARVDLRRALDQITQVAGDVPRATVAVARLRMRVYTRLAEVDHDLQVIRTHLISARNNLEKAAAGLDDDEDFADEAGHYGQRLDSADGLLQTARDLSKVCDDAHTLREWEIAITAWNVALADAPMCIGLRYWYDEVFMVRQRTDLQRQLAGAELPGLRLTPLARLAMLDEPVPDDLRSEADSLAGMTESILEDVKGRGAADTRREQAQVAALREASYALYYLLSGSLDVTPPEDDGDEAAQLTGLRHDPLSAVTSERLVSLLTRRGAHLEQIRHLISVSKGLLATSLVTGDFAPPLDALDPILAADGAYAKYHEHQAVRAFIEEFQATQAEHRRLQTVAASMVDAFQKELFDEVRALAARLTSPEARRYHAHLMPRTTDPSAGDAVLDGAEEIADRAAEMQRQVADLQTWLGPVIDPAVLMRAIRPEKNRLPAFDPASFDPGQTRVVAFAALDRETVKPLRDSASYDAAEAELWRIEHGHTNDDVSQDPVAYDEQRLSLAQVQRILAEQKPYGSEAELKSHTAVAIWRWVVVLWDHVDREYEALQVRRRDVQMARTEFNLELQRFYDAFDSLEARLLRRRNRVAVLDELRAAYEHIRHGPLDDDDQRYISGHADVRYPLYPLAPAYDRLDVHYSRYVRRR